MLEIRNQGGKEKQKNKCKKGENSPSSFQSPKNKENKPEAESWHK